MWRSSSIGGCPLEEASEQERNPSIIGSNGWCFPTSRVSIIKLCFYILLFYIYCGDFVFSLWFLTSGIRALSLGRHNGKIFFIFADFFFRSRKKGPRHSRSFHYISVKNLQKRVVYLISSQKNTQFEKKIVRNGVQEVKILKF